MLHLELFSECSVANSHFLSMRVSPCVRGCVSVYVEGQSVLSRIPSSDFSSERCTWCERKNSTATLLVLHLVVQLLVQLLVHSFLIICFCQTMTGQ